jgi:type II secretory pathway pseudopilin PulG
MRIGTLVLVVLLGASVASAVQLWRLYGAERERAQVLEATVAELRTRVAAAESAAGAARRAGMPDAGAAPAPRAAGPEAPAHGSRGSSAEPDPGPPRLPGPEDFERMRERQAALFRDPAYRRAMLLQMRASVRRAHPDVAREVGLTPDEADRFFDLLAERSLPDPDSLTFGTVPDAAQVAALRTREQARDRALRGELQSLLGEERWARWEGYQRALPERMQAQQIRETFAAAGVPLSVDQAPAVVRAVLDEQRRMADEFRRAQPPRGALVASPRPATGGAVVPGAVVGNPMVAIPTPASPAVEADLRRQRELWLAAQEASNRRLHDALAEVLDADQLARFMETREAELAMQRAQLAALP